MIKAEENRGSHRASASSQAVHHSRGIRADRRLRHSAIGTITAVRFWDTVGAVFTATISSGMPAEWFGLLACPAVAVAGLMIALLTYALRDARLQARRHRRRCGRCPRCDYDLTGNVSGVCPECGSSNL